MKIKLTVSLLLMLAGVFSVVSADELVLHEGKTIKGKIISEKGDEVMIHLANNMFLTVDKSKIKHIVRDAKDARPRVTMQTIRTSTTAAPTPAAKTQAPPAPKTALKNIPTSFSTERKKKDGVSFEESVHVQTYTVIGADFEAVKESILSRDGGKGFLKGGRRMPSETQLAVSWTGKARKEAGKTKWADVVVIATTTVSYPSWKAPESADDASLKAWADYLAELAEHDDGHVEIYRAALKTLGQSLSNLEAADEDSLNAASKSLVSTWRKRTEKQQEGHDRRGREKEKHPKKAP